MGPDGGSLFPLVGFLGAGEEGPAGSWRLVLGRRRRVTWRGVVLLRFRGVVFDGLLLGGSDCIIAARVMAAGIALPVGLTRGVLFDGIACLIVVFDRGRPRGGCRCAGLG